MKQMKKVLLASVMLVAIGCGVTLAYLNTITNTAVNTFSSNKKLTLELREPTWDGYEFGMNYPSGVTPGKEANAAATNKEELGVVRANSYYPADLIPKNPTVKNTCDENEYVAIKVEYITVIDNQETTITKEEFNKTIGKTVVAGSNAEIKAEFTQIKEDKAYDIYAYGKQDKLTVLSAGNTTPSLFDKVMINPNIETKDGKLPSFRIEITAYAVQSVNVDTLTAIEELTKLANSN